MFLDFPGVVRKDHYFDVGEPDLPNSSHLPEYRNAVLMIKKASY